MSLDCAEIWCLGDLVGVPASGETIKLALEHCRVVIAGNHDLLAAGRLSEAYLETHGRDRILAARKELDAEAMNALRGLPTEARDGDLQAAHASLDHLTDHVSDRFDADNQLALADCRYLALGHAHRAFCFAGDGRWIVEPEGEIKLGDAALISPGSVRPIADRPGTVCVLDTSAGTCSWYRLSSTGGNAVLVEDRATPTRHLD